MGLTREGAPLNIAAASLRQLMPFARKPGSAGPLSERTQVTVLTALAGVLLAVLFAPSLTILVTCWVNNPQYSHGFLVPVISAALAWRWVRRAGRPASGQAALGGLEVLAGCMLHWATDVIFVPQLDFLALAVCLRGLALAVGGRHWARGLTFPIGFLFFMYPLPYYVTATAAVWLQDAVASVSASVLELVIVCYQRGSSLYLAGVETPLVVAPECSGLRQIETFVAIAALLGYLSQRSVVRQVLFVLAAFPAAILANVARVLLMVLGVRWFGSAWLDGSLHDVPAMFTVPFGLALLLATGWALGSYGGGTEKEVAA